MREIKEDPNKCGVMIWSWIGRDLKLLHIKFIFKKIEN